MFIIGCAFLLLAQPLFFGGGDNLKKLTPSIFWKNILFQNPMFFQEPVRVT